MSKLKERKRTKYRVSEDEWEALERSAVDAREGRFASEREVAALFERYREHPDQRRDRDDLFGAQMPI